MNHVLSHGTETASCKWIHFACYMCQTRDSEVSYSAVLTVPSPFMQVNKLYTVGHPFTNCALGTLGTVSFANSPGEDVELSNYIRMPRFQFAERRSQRCRASMLFKVPGGGHMGRTFPGRGSSKAKLRKRRYPTKWRAANDSVHQPRVREDNVATKTCPAQSSQKKTKVQAP